MRGNPQGSPARSIKKQLVKISILTSCARLHSEPGLLFVMLRYPSETMAGRWDWMV